MSLTVRKLTEIPHLRTSLVAGDRGAGQVIAWAQSVEIERPWEWLNAGDLLMTTGLGMPSDAKAQVGYVEALTAAGVTGVAVGTGREGSHLTPSMLAAADRAGLPILKTAFDVPFSEIGRAVAASRQGAEHERLVRMARIYDVTRNAVARGSGAAEVLRSLADEVDCDLWVCADESGRSVLPPYESPPPALRTALCQAARSRDATKGALVRLRSSPHDALAVPVDARRPVSLLALPRGEHTPSFALLQHVATLATLELERHWAARDEAGAAGAETLDQLLREEVSPHTAAAQLARAGLDRGPFVVAAITDDGSWPGAAWLHLALAERLVPGAVAARSGARFALLPSGLADHELLGDVFAGAAAVGVSDPFDQLDGLATAVSEARWALRSAGRDEDAMLRFHEQHSPFGPRSVAEARTAVEHVLRPVIAYDEEHGSELVKSLASFLRRNRSWQRAAEELFVHKQTLVYRMRRVEQLTGRRLADTATVADLWFALEALEVIDGA